MAFGHILPLLHPSLITLGSLALYTKTVFMMHGEKVAEPCGVYTSRLLQLSMLHRAMTGLVAVDRRTYGGKDVGDVAQ